MAPPAIPSRTTSASARRRTGSASGSVRTCRTAAATSGGVVVVVGRQDALPAERVERHDGAAVGLLEHRARERRGRRPEGDLPAVEAEDKVPGLRLLDGV